MGCNQYSDTPLDELRRSCNDNPVPGSMLQTNVLRRTKGGMISCGDYLIALLTFVVLLLLCSCSKSEQDERKRIRDASIYTSKKISLKFLFLSDIFLFPFVRQ